MSNLEIYNKVRSVPSTAQKPIQAGRLKGMTDVNPMWRIKMLTELFGVCGIGWYTEIAREWEKEGADGTIAVFVDVNLYVKVDGEWSKPIFGTGGSMFVTKESKGLYTSDEAYKMAYTDALSVCCKALGFGADVYWEKDKTKYSPQVDNKKSEVYKKKDEDYKKKDEVYKKKSQGDNKILNLDSKNESFDAEKAKEEKPHLSKDKQQEIMLLIAQTNADFGVLLETYKVNSLGELSEASYKNIKDILTKRLKKE